MGKPIKPELFADLYPFTSHYLQIGEHSLHYLDEGQGEALVMVHGNPTWSFYFRNLILGLRQDFRLIVPDHIGCGLSDKPQKYPYTLGQHIDNLEALLETLGLSSISLAMHDWGGAIGMGYAIRHPEKIKRLVIFNTAAFLSSRLPWQLSLCRIPLFGQVAIRGFNAFAGLAIYMACCHHERMLPKVKAGYLAPYNSYQNRIANLRFVQDIPRHPNNPSYPILKAIEEKLPLFQHLPVLILWGGRDFCFNESFLNTWQHYLPKAEVHVFPDAGHYVVEDAYERILPLLKQFLVRLYSARVIIQSPLSTNEVKGEK